MLSEENLEDTGKNKEKYLPFSLSTANILMHFLLMFSYVHIFIPNRSML